MKYDGMPAGPEMDQMVGIKCTDFESVYIRNGKCRCIRRLINNAHDDERMWSPTTDIFHAMEAAEWLAGMPGQWFHCGIDHDSMNPEGAYWAAFSDPSGFAGLTGKPKQARAETMPLAICRAALRAIS